MQKDNKIFEDIAKLASGAAGSMLEMKRELQHMMSDQLEKMLATMNLATREEVDTLHGMIAKCRTEQEELKKRLEVAEKKLASK